MKKMCVAILAVASIVLTGGEPLNLLKAAQVHISSRGTVRIQAEPGVLVGKNNKTGTLQKIVKEGNYGEWSTLNFTLEAEQKENLFVILTAPNHPARPAVIYSELKAAGRKLENCDFSQGADDCINFHDCSSYGKKNSPKSIISRHNYGSDGAIIEFRKSDYSPTGFFSARSHAKKLPDGNYEIFFNSELPDVPRNNFILFDKTYDTRNIIVRDCYFHHNRARGILILARDVTIENCRFKHNEMGAIKIETGYTTNIWCEGFGVENVVIRNNIFDTSNPLDVKTMGYARDIFIGTYLKRDPSREQTTYPILNNILFESNTFKDTFGMVTTMGSAGHIYKRDAAQQSSPIPRAILYNALLRYKDSQQQISQEPQHAQTWSSNRQRINQEYNSPGK